MIKFLQMPVVRKADDPKNWKQNKGTMELKKGARDDTSPHAVCLSFFCCPGSSNKRVLHVMNHAPLDCKAPQVSVLSVNPTKKGRAQALRRLYKMQQDPPLGAVCQSWQNDAITRDALTELNPHTRPTSPPLICSHWCSSANSQDTKEETGTAFPSPLALWPPPHARLPVGIVFIRSYELVRVHREKLRRK